MRRFAAVLFGSLAIVEARAQSASSTLRGLDECFARTSVAEATCDQADSDTTTRLACRLKAHTAEKLCLDGIFAKRDEITQPNDMPSKPRSRAPPGPPASEPAPKATEPSRDDTVAALPTVNGWLIGETTSPRDFSPLLVAKLYALPPVAVDAPAILLLRCRGQRTEMSLGVNGAWRALRGGDIEVTVSSDQPAARPWRWRLAPDGRTASMLDDPVDVVRALSGGRTTISVTDGTGRNASAIFDLTGIDVVRARLGSACHWPNTTVESRGR
ncbi:hypothetical protein ABIB73_004418 [Bradyrhizobium sp. F1.4.3]|uniref:hypothetical protein n=1 Tax=Bradyrhizobium sp. F1.4.3 TaxID=3156356 RepID=UPI0033934666